jgi:hypothetical protein
VSEIEEVRFATDSPVEGDEFEPSVPRREIGLVDATLGLGPILASASNFDPTPILR